eukprot:TRINITY_DN4020_c0_g1_i8.p1 TRINITY_DN4020_c0_g1~~TRINITY_DN4020_c0_g1_i8.p1  ORF type:complete len:165 (+),score=24.49 TRINITY_DN4020_c0_g1_i8:65-496(+)
MACCKRNCGMSPKVLEQVQSKLKEIHQIYPGTHFTCILSPDGEVLAFDNNKSQHPADMMGPVASMKKAALQFGSSMNQLDCPVIHIRGNNHLFSCFDIDTNILAFFSEMHGSVLDSFNTNEADQQMEPILEELRLLLQNMLAT